MFFLRLLSKARESWTAHGSPLLTSPAQSVLPSPSPPCSLQSTEPRAGAGMEAGSRLDGWGTPAQR